MERVAPSAAAIWHIHLGRYIKLFKAQVYYSDKLTWFIYSTAGTFL